MRLKDIAGSDLVERCTPSFEDCRRYGSRMPALDSRFLQVRLMLGGDRLALRSAVGGDASLVLFYKGKEGAVTCLEELQEGEEWNILQSKGATSKRAYRVTTSLMTSLFFGRMVRTLAESPQTTVRRVRMPDYHHLKNIDGVASHRVERVMQAYAQFRSALQMVYSEAERAYVFEPASKKRSSLGSSPGIASSPATQEEV